MTSIYDTPADFIERYDNCVDDMGVAFAFEPRKMQIEAGRNLPTRH